MNCPPPLEWHPAYRDKTNLIEWLNNQGPYADRDCLLIPFARQSSLKISALDSYPETSPYITMRLDRQLCYGSAPYVGRPFAYVWNVAIDNVGRAIAGESRIQYIGEKL